MKLRLIVVTLVVLAVIVAIIVGTIGRRPDPSATTESTGIVALINHSTSDDELFLGQFCGGTVISSDEVMTATHCVDRRTPDTIDVVAGVTDLCAKDRKYERVAVVAFSPGPDASTTVLNLAGSLDQLPLQTLKMENLHIGDEVLATGWGRSTIAGVPRCKLRAVRLSMVPAAECSQLMVALSSTGSKQQLALCTVPSRTENTCDGDSGGPVVIHDGAVWKTVAVTMSGSGCTPDSVGLNIGVEN
jgi:secreted trypsin-like serine protease